MIPGSGPWCVGGGAPHGAGDHKFMPESSAGAQP